MSGDRLLVRCVRRIGCAIAGAALVLSAAAAFAAAPSPQESQRRSVPPACVRTPPAITGDPAARRRAEPPVGKPQTKQAPKDAAPGAQTPERRRAEPAAPENC